MKSLVLFGVLLCTIITGEAASRAYENLLGGNSIMRKCGMTGDMCVSDVNCCPEYTCSDQLICQLSDTETVGGGKRGAHCTTDVDCQPGLCCHGSLYERTCTANCPKVPDTEVIPAGTYYGRQFWNLWTRKRRMDHRNWI
ncbi:unnamed protein product [Echinostoma caproni]|uniref:Dickkopf_N domain-containing protein n=1 Tax=Echinostoma caproni TaxID=27848 RepID=A0A183A6J5_9TREM|nr:unnamed protein product [Echinostoma caproni]